MRSIGVIIPIAAAGSLDADEEAAWYGAEDLDESGEPYGISCSDEVLDALMSG